MQFLLASMGPENVIDLPSHVDVGPRDLHGADSVVEEPPWNFFAAMQFLLASMGPENVIDLPLKFSWSYIVTFMPFGMSMLLSPVPTTPQFLTWHKPLSSSHDALLAARSPPAPAAPPNTCAPASRSRQPGGWNPGGAPPPPPSRRRPTPSALAAPPHTPPLRPRAASSPPRALAP
eukprot:CAMPEP_0172053836 /NCGR_PEP_ID=MMETSP1043-20130122/4427_1 /TAXON_ID=464988 /ORGANISM="Hemiselmis andersenii, Strain CCMP441" /LENGTH=175 /DNA_ID=CAMNT_0012713129 /DNA_START=108 /DNA_END=634 /DNA_ORIENTATION=+